MLHSHYTLNEVNLETKFNKIFIRDWMVQKLNHVSVFTYIDLNEFTTKLGKDFSP
jgi:hypothetical protein